MLAAAAASVVLAAAATGPCAPAGSTPIRATAGVRVYLQHGRYYGCLLSSGVNRMLAAKRVVTYPDAYVTDAVTTFRRSSIGGHWVAWTQLESSSGEGINSSSIHAVDLDTGRTTSVRVDSQNGTIPRLIAVSSSGALAWLLPNAGGSITVGNDGTAPQIAVAKFGRDRNEDLAVLDASVYLLRGRGDGTFASPALAVRPPDAQQLAVADVNDDGIPDLIVGEGDSHVIVYLGRTDRSFVPGRVIHVPLPSVDVMAVGDVNGDGTPDLVLATQTPGRDLGDAFVMLGDGHGGFGLPEAYRVGGTNDAVGALTVGDALGDGHADLVAGLSDRIAILPGGGHGGFGPAIRLPWSERKGPGVGAIAIGNLQRGAKPDLVIGAGAIEVFRGLGADRFAPVKRYRVNDPVVGVSSVALGDVNGDRKLDVVAGRVGDGIDVLDGDGRGRLGRPQYYRAGTGNETIALGAFGGGARLDIAAANNGSGDVSILLNDGLGDLSGATLDEELYVSQSGVRQRLASGVQIPANSIHFDGNLLSWTANGLPAQAAV